MFFQGSEHMSSLFIRLIALSLRHPCRRTLGLLVFRLCPSLWFCEPQDVCAVCGICHPTVESVIFQQQVTNPAHNELQIGYRTDAGSHSRKDASLPRCHARKTNLALSSPLPLAFVLRFAGICLVTVHTDCGRVNFSKEELNACGFIPGRKTYSWTGGQAEADLLHRLHRRNGAGFAVWLDEKGQIKVGEENILCFA